MKKVIHKLLISVVVGLVNSRYFHVKHGNKSSPTLTLFLGLGIMPYE